MSGQSSSKSSYSRYMAVVIRTACDLAARHHCHVDLHNCHVCFGSSSPHPIHSKIICAFMTEAVPGSIRSTSSRPQKAHPPMTGLTTDLGNQLSPACHLLWLCGQRELASFHSSLHRLILFIHPRKSVFIHAESPLFFDVLDI